jgi:hypothetical protein
MGEKELNRWRPNHFRAYHEAHFRTPSSPFHG